MWLVIRIFGIVVGIASLLRLATQVAGITYREWFQAWMDSLRDILELGLLVKVLEMQIIVPALDWIRSAGWQLPQLGQHWQPIFVLSWLVFGATAKSGPMGLVGQTSAAYALIAGFACSLLTSVCAGLSPGGSFAVLVWWTLAVPLYVMLTNLVSRSEGSTRRAFTMAGLSVPWIGLALFLVYASNDLKDYHNPVWQLAWLSVLVVYASFLGLVYIGVGLASPGAVWERVTHPATSAGLSVLSSLGGALFIATLVADPPLW